MSVRAARAFVIVLASVAAVVVVTSTRARPARTYTSVENGDVAPDTAAKIYALTCGTCHQPDGQGLSEKDKNFPPLARSEWVLGSENRMIRIMLQGLVGEVEVQGETFDGEMPSWGPTFTDFEVAAVATYVRSQWGNKASAVTPATVARIRLETADRKKPWTIPELRKIAP